MIFSIYVVLGIFLILAARDIYSFTDPGQMGHLWGDVGGLYLTAIVLTLLARPLNREMTPA